MRTDSRTLMLALTAILLVAMLTALLLIQPIVAAYAAAMLLAVARVIRAIQGPGRSRGGKR